MSDAHDLTTARPFVACPAPLTDGSLPVPFDFDRWPHPFGPLVEEPVEEAVVRKP